MEHPPQEDPTRCASASSRARLVALFPPESQNRQRHAGDEAARAAETMLGDTPSDTALTGQGPTPLRGGGSSGAASCPPWAFCRTRRTVASSTPTSAATWRCDLPSASTAAARLTVQEPFQMGRSSPPRGLTGKRKPAVSSGFTEAGDGARTHDPQLGKLMLYQLSYAREPFTVAASSGRGGRARPPRGSSSAPRGCHRTAPSPAGRSDPLRQTSRSIAHRTGQSFCLSTAFGAVLKAAARPLASARAAAAAMRQPSTSSPCNGPSSRFDLRETWGRRTRRCVSGAPACMRRSCSALIGFQRSSTTSAGSP